MANKWYHGLGQISAAEGCTQIVHSEQAIITTSHYHIGIIIPNKTDRIHILISYAMRAHNLCGTRLNVSNNYCGIIAASDDLVPSGRIAHRENCHTAAGGLVHINPLTIVFRAIYWHYINYKQKMLHVYYAIQTQGVGGVQLTWTGPSRIGKMLPIWTKISICDAPVYVARINAIQQVVCALRAIVDADIAICNNNCALTFHSKQVKLV